MEILVLFDSKGGNTYALAQAIAEGIQEVEGMTARIRRTKETTPLEVIRSNAEWAKFYDEVRVHIPEASVDDIVETEGLALGSPTRFGNKTASVANYIESLGGLWAKGALVGKVGGVFGSTTTMHGGNEATLLTMLIPLIHLGYVIVPMGYSDANIVSTKRGGTPYGPSSVSGQEAPTPNDVELQIARTYGKKLAEVTKKLRS